MTNSGGTGSGGEARSAGVFQIRNLATDEIFVAAGHDLTGIMNRHRFQLRHRMHANRRLQEDWNRLGEESFAFEVLDHVGAAGSESEADAELASVLAYWIDELRPFGERGYNAPVASREEKLRRIALGRRGRV